MAKWTRVGDIPKKIPVNFMVDSSKYPELAAWIYAFPHGDMGKTVRDILNAHLLSGAGGGGSVCSGGGGEGGGARPHGGKAHAGSLGAAAAVLPGTRGEDAPNPDRRAGRRGDVSPHEEQTGIAPAVRGAEGAGDQPAMDAGTANALNQLDQGF